VPSVQHGSVVKRGRTWSARWYDETGKRQSRGGFATKSDAREWLDNQVRAVRAIRRGDAPARGEPLTVQQLVDEFLRLREANPEADAATTRKLRSQLRHATARLGDGRVDALGRLELEAWRFGLPDGSRHDVFRAFRQVLAWGVEGELTTRNASIAIKNPKRRRHERRDVHPFESWQQVEAIADELDARYRAIPLVLVGTGLRPGELFGLDRQDVDREAGVLHVRRRFTQGVLKDGGKTDGSTRTVPLRQRVLDALDSMPTRIDTPVLFPAPRGGRIDGEKFRHREWAPALRAAGIPHRRVYDCRHTFATWTIESGVEVLYLARIMGTSVAQIEDTYARWLKRTDEQLRSLLDAYDERTVANGR
jgi:integrase